MSDRTDINDPSEKMVLRTVYLPPELDEKLRVWAFRTKVSKGDVIRQAVARELETVSGFGNDSEPARPITGDKPKSGKAKPAKSLEY
jgi:hypothetical protein